MAVRGVVLVSTGALGLVGGGLWWWAALRLVFVPEHAGLVEGAVAAGGWGLSLLPVHVRASSGVTKASRRRRSGAGSAPS
jgi:hypothetical protein